MVEFFKLLYRHCQPGFLHIIPFPYNDDLSKFFLDTSKGFEQISEFIDQYEKETFWKEWFFDLNLYSVPKHAEKFVSTVACFQTDIDHSFDRKILERFKPSIKVRTMSALCSPSGVERFHFYYIFKTPIRPCLDYQMKMMRLYKLFMYKRYVYSCTGYMLHARVPGTRNSRRELVTYEASEPFIEYDYGDFDNLPSLDIAEALHYGNTYMRMFREKKWGIVSKDWGP